jgi:predicted short-subunit dehydrogenase-like oxidoreductase (DUF2520 family)
MNNEGALDDSSPVAVVGAGAVGTALARRLAEQGRPVQAILSRDRADAQALAERVGASVASDAWTDLPEAVRVVFLCVPDDALPDVARALAAVAHPWTRTVVGHTSGARTAAVLAPLADAGAATLSFHPLQTFTPDTPPDAFADVAIGIEGAPAAVAAGTALARALGARPVELSARGKALYHCAAALASNGLVALMAVVEELLAAADVEGEEASAAALMAPLVEQTWANLRSATPEGVLTGPVARGDRDTVAAHLEALREEAPHLLPLYAALSTEMARVAVRGGQTEAPSAEEVLQMLQRALPSSSDDSAPPTSSH